MKWVIVVLACTPAALYGGLIAALAYFPCNLC